MTQPLSAPVTTHDIDDPSGFQHRFTDLHRLRMHYVEEGAGPTVLLLHGFPFLWYTWRHQIKALSDAGYRVLAPDLRGFGQTSQPSEIADYGVSRFVGDLVGLIRSLGETSVAVVGHGLGSHIAYHCVAMRPDIFSAIAMLSSAPQPWRFDGSPRWWDGIVGHHGLVSFEDYLGRNGTADEINKDLPQFLMGMYRSLSGDCPDEERLRWVWSTTEHFRAASGAIAGCGALSEKAADYYIEQYRKSGIRAPSTWFRALDIDWSARSFLDGVVVDKPALFACGSRDPWFRPLHGIDPRPRILRNLRQSFTAVDELTIAGAGHLLPEERPTEINEILARFLSSLVDVSR